MIKIKSYSLSTRLAISILLLAAPIFIISVGVLFFQARQIIRHEAVGRANSALNATMQRLNLNLITIETATNAYCWLAEQQMNPDSLFAISHNVVALNPHIDGCSISTEPELFPEIGRYFSVYTVRENDSVTTVIEEKYEYFQKIWYKTPKQQGACWAVYFDEADSLELTIDGMLASYGKPLYNDNNEIVGIISTDLSLLQLSKIISTERPYPNSYFMMLDGDGHYVVHPDSSRLFNKTIFDGTNPREHSDLITLGHEMTAGKKGSMPVYIDGTPCLVCYEPVPGTSWSLAIVCPDNDILKGYYKLTNILIPLLIIGLLLIMALCHRAVAHAIHPINQLLAKTRSIAEGNMEVHISKSSRIDAVGRLQNSFAAMLQTLNFHLGSVRYITEKTQQRNEELEQVTKLAKEADHQKIAFIQNVSHQIRTPLNIIMGFAQILRDTSSQHEAMPEEEMKSITSTMEHHSKLLYRLVNMLFDSSDTGFSEELNSHQFDLVNCNKIARESISYLKQHYPNANTTFESDLPDDFCFQTNHLYLLRCLRELLYNSAKYSDGQHILLKITRTSKIVSFIVEDKGMGIDEADRERMFKFFTKVDDLSEGLGLGLPLAKRHALNLGGDMRLDETYHEGCRFILDLPLKPNDYD